MARLRIRTREEFRAALEAIPAAAELLGREEPQLNEYRLWFVLRDAVNGAVEQRDWETLGRLLELYEGVARVGRKSEMHEASYVAFLEDVRLPKDPADLRRFWLHSPPAFEAAIRRDRGL